MRLSASDGPLSSVNAGCENLGNLKSKSPKNDKGNFVRRLQNVFFLLLPFLSTIKGNSDWLRLFSFEKKIKILPNNETLFSFFFYINPVISQDTDQ